MSSARPLLGGLLALVCPAIALAQDAETLFDRCVQAEASRPVIGGVNPPAGASAALDASGERPDAALLERRCYGGRGLGLNIRGSGLDFELDALLAFGRSHVTWAQRLSARALVLPRMGVASPKLWGLFIGGRFATFGGAGEGRPGVSLQGSNVELTIGAFAHTLLQRFRIEVDLAPVLPTHPHGIGDLLVAQTSLLAALAISPRDDLLFLPNLRNGGRLRALVRVQGQPFYYWGWSLDLAATTGFASVQTDVGAASGFTGGLGAALRLNFRTLERIVNGIYVRGSADMGLTSLWPTDVLVPIRLEVAGGLALGRSVELSASWGLVMPNPGFPDRQSTTQLFGMSVRVTPAFADEETVMGWVASTRDADPSRPPTAP